MHIHFEKLQYFNIMLVNLCKMVTDINICYVIINLGNKYRLAIN